MRMLKSHNDGLVVTPPFNKLSLVGENDTKGNRRPCLGADTLVTRKSTPNKIAKSRNVAQTFDMTTSLMALVKSGL